MKRLLIVFTAVVVVAVCLVAGCVSTGKTYIDDEETINSRIGEEFVIALDSNPTTGYEWMASYDDSVLTLTYEDYDAEKCPGLVGAGGTYYFGFEAIKKGETQITLDYQREPENKSIDRRVFTISIK